MIYFNPRIPLLLLILISNVLLSCEQKPFTSSRNLDFNKDWEFIEKDIEAGFETKQNDEDWRIVNFPHDWSVENLPNWKKSEDGPFVKDLPGGVDVGYLRGGIGWYRKTFTVDHIIKDKEVYLHFDGVMGHARIWVNEQEVGEHVYGYTPFYFNISEFLNAPGEGNTVAIRVEKPEENSRWFTGAGIYRSVEISYIDPIHVAIWGVKTNSMIDGNDVNLQVELAIENHLEIESDLEIVTIIDSPDGTRQPWIPSEYVSISSPGKKVNLSGTIVNPKYWNLDEPNLYAITIHLYKDGKQLDEYVQEFGIRDISYSATEGFILNGKSILMKGACLHHDNGLLGAKAFQAAEERRIRIMKENGYNAIRTAHNPPSKFFLEACDKLGMLVIDESFDMWIKPKRVNDYHQHFESWWERDLETMLLRDMNHPSIVMWSFGNEVQERADEKGVEIAKACIDKIKSIDQSRPVTQAVCGFWDNPGKVWEETKVAFEILDVSGYNYRWDRYESDHESFPERIMYGSESVAAEAWDNWNLVEKLPYVIGDFVWTGMDYIGESGIGYSIYPGPNDEQIHLMPWPTYLAWCGDIDITGNKKAQSYYRDVIWNESDLEILIHEPNPSGNEEVTSFWGWPNEEPRWHWPGHEGEELQVNVYTNYEKIRLELNGESIGEKELRPEDRNTLTFNVNYKPGILKAVGIADGKISEEKELATPGKATNIVIEPESNSIAAGVDQVIFIPVKVIDEKGILVGNFEREVSVEVSGPGDLIASGSASPVAPSGFTNSTFNLYRGRGLVVIRSTGIEGEISVMFESGSISSEIAIIEVFN